MFKLKRLCQSRIKGINRNAEAVKTQDFYFDSNDTGPRHISTFNSRTCNVGDAHGEFRGFGRKATCSVSDVITCILGVMRSLAGKISFMSKLLKDNSISLVFFRTSGVLPVDLLALLLVRNGNNNLC